MSCPHSHEIGLASSSQSDDIPWLVRREGIPAPGVQLHGAIDFEKVAFEGVRDPDGRHGTAQQGSLLLLEKSPKSPVVHEMLRLAAGMVFGQGDEA